MSDEIINVNDHIKFNTTSSNYDIYRREETFRSAKVTKIKDICCNRCKSNNIMNLVMATHHSSFISDECCIQNWSYEDDTNVWCIDCYNEYAKEQIKYYNDPYKDDYTLALEKLEGKEGDERIKEINKLHWDVAWDLALEQKKEK